MAGPGGAVRVAAVSDFIAPAPACVVVEGAGAPGAGAAAEGVPAGGRMGLHAPGGGKADEAPVLVSLHDCLACSGCVTSAESVLLEHQSARELEERLADGFSVVVTLSPPAVASLAQRAGLRPSEAQGSLVAFFRGIGAAAVLDDSAGRELALLEAADEFVERFQARARGAQEGGTGPGGGSEEAAGPLPMLASECPGWVCYAEKTHGAAVLPYLAAGRSAQGMAGGLTKRLLGGRLGVPPERIYHCAVAPCYDKKLEASRADFAPAGIPETDCVLTAGEVQRLLEERGVDLDTIEAQPLDSLTTPPEAGPGGGGALPGGETASGGYLHFVYREAARRLFNAEVPLGALPLERGRNPDFHELTLRGPDGEPQLRFAQAYGFRNIQNVVRNLKRGKSKYDYVEVMACPSGCLNGGGQVKPREGETNKELLLALEGLYGAGFEFRNPYPAAAAARRALEEAGGDPRAAARTEYHAREQAPPALTVLSNW